MDGEKVVGNQKMSRTVYPTWKFNLVCIQNASIRKSKKVVIYKTKKTLYILNILLEHGWIKNFFLITPWHYCVDLLYSKHKPILWKFTFIKQKKYKYIPFRFLKRIYNKTFFFFNSPYGLLTSGDMIFNLKTGGNVIFFIRKFYEKRYVDCFQNY